MAIKASGVKKDQRSIWTENNIKPKSYQKRISENTNKILQSKKGGIIIAPAGAGKSYILSDIAYKAIQQNKPIIITQPSRSLLEQNLETFIELGIINSENMDQVSVLVNKNEPVYWGNKKSPENQIKHGLHGNIIFATCGSLIRAHEDIEEYLQKEPFMLFDEFHRAGAQETKQILKLFKNNIIGLTATPFRADYYDLGELFNDTLQNVIIDLVTYQEAIDEGTIVPGKISLGSRKRFQELVGEEDIWELENIFEDKNNNQNTDFLSQQIFGQIFQPHATKEEKKLAHKMVASTVKLWQERSEKRNTITHAENTFHAKMLFEAFKALNDLDQKHTIAYIDADEAMYFDGKDLITAKGAESRRLRQRILKDAKDNKIKNIINCHVVKEGINIPSASCTLMACYRRSLGPAIQTIGRTSRSYKNPVTGEIKKDHIIIDTGTTLSHIAKYDNRFNQAEININNVDSQNKFNYEIIQKLGFFGIPEEEMKYEYQNQQEDDKKRLLRKLSNLEIKEITDNVQKILSLPDSQSKITKIDLKDYKGEDKNYKEIQTKDLVSLGQGAWASSKNDSENTTIFIFRKDALNKIFPFFVNKNTHISEYITITIGQNKSIEISSLNNASEIKPFLISKDFLLNEKEQNIEKYKKKNKPTNKQENSLKYQYESLRKNYLARLISPIFAKESMLNAEIALSLTNNWENIGKSFASWLQKEKTKTPMYKNQAISKQKRSQDTIMICAIPGCYTNNDLKNYIEKSKELSYGFQNIIIVGNTKNSGIKQIIDHCQKNNIKTTIINSAEMTQNINNPKYKSIAQKWFNKDLKFFGTTQSIKQVKNQLTSTLNKQKETQRIIA